MMKLIAKYLIMRLTLMSGYALLSILALYSFIDLLSEVGNIGTGTYTGWTACRYIVLQMPARAYQLMPLATLIGGLLAFNQLSGSSEWVVMKTSGLSLRDIIVMVLQFSVIFAVLTVGLEEWLAPDFSRRADVLKATAKSGQVSAAQDGMWLKQGDSMVNIHTMLPDNTLIGIKIWRYNPQFQLVEAISAEKAQVLADKWLLHNVHSSQLSDKQVHTTHLSEREWASHVNQSLLNVLLVKPEQMSFMALTDYLDYLKKNHQETKVYEVAWWNKLVYPIATMVMSLVALAFTPHSGRHTNLGLQLFGGICLGLLFFFTGRLFGFTTQLYGVPAFLSAVLPTAVFAAWAIYLIRKQEIR